ncbi:MAG: hypothetical protein WC675_02855 [Patescibacteria group bacterium]|jgi:hypothetical protein
MEDDDLMPDATFDLKPGQSVTYDRRVRISVNEAGQLVIGGQCDPRIVEFHYSGVACAYHCFAVRTNGRVKVFRGNATGSGMITKEAVYATCGLC